MKMSHSEVFPQFEGCWAFLPSPALTVLREWAHCWRHSCAKTSRSDADFSLRARYLFRVSSRFLELDSQADERFESWWPGGVPCSMTNK